MSKEKVTEFKPKNGIKITKKEKVKCLIIVNQDDKTFVFQDILGIGQVERANLLEIVLNMETNMFIQTEKIKAMQFVLIGYDKFQEIRGDKDKILEYAEDIQKDHVIG